MNFVQPIRDKEKIAAMMQLLKDQSERNYMLFFLGINTGLRVSDLLKLKVKDVRGKDSVLLRETKTKKSRRIFWNPHVYQVLQEYVKDKQDDEFLFPSRRKGKPLSRIQAWRILNETARQVGLDEIGTHTLRKTYGYHYYNQSKNIALLQEIFNHSSPAITLRYIGINQDILEKETRAFALGV
jgi:integrase